MDSLASMTSSLKPLRVMAPCLVSRLMLTSLFFSTASIFFTLGADTVKAKLLRSDRGEGGGGGAERKKEKKKERERERERERNRQTDRQTDRQAETQSWTDGQTDRDNNRLFFFTWYQDLRSCPCLPTRQYLSTVRTVI